jgi:hypothetical protein
VTEPLLDAICAVFAGCVTGIICGVPGLASTSPGKKNIRGEKLWVVAMPAQPVPSPSTTAAAATHFIIEPTLTQSTIVMIRIMATIISYQSHLVGETLTLEVLKIKLDFARK